MAPGESLALYRTYRVQFFRELIGQEHVARTLRNAVARGRVAHAYLFAGPRGTGKTSVARILARAVNCEGTPAEPGEPCGTCAPCVSIADGSALDVLEIDAASNRGIDEMRELRERARYAPGRLRTKVYIIDEAHMLTVEAFNALLKTLEEPPPRTLFVLATTEPQRIPPTIASRCQHFEFRRLSIAQIMQRLHEVCEREGIEAEQAALYAIARHARGGMRDALALLDQARAFDGEGRVRTAEVHDLLGTADDEALMALTAAALDGDAGGGLSVIQGLTDRGREPRQVLQAWIEHLRDLLVLQAAGPREELLAVPQDLLPRLRELADRMPRGVLVDLVGYLAERDAIIRGVTNPRLVLESAFLVVMRRLGTREAEAAPRPAAAAATAAGARARGKASPAEAEPAEPERDTGLAQAGTPAPTRDEPAPVAAAGETADLSGETWQRILEQLRRRNRRAHALLQDGRPLALRGGRLEIGFAHAFHRDACDQPAVREAIERACEAVLGRPVTVRPVLTAAEAEGGAPVRPRDPVPDPPAAPPRERTERAAGERGPEPAGHPARRPLRAASPAEASPAPAAREEDDLIDQALALFGGQFVDPGEGWQ